LCYETAAIIFLSAAAAKPEWRCKVEKKVLNAMKKVGKPVRPGEVAKMIGEDSKQVSKAINELKKQGKIVSPKRCFWEPA